MFTRLFCLALMPALLLGGTVHAATWHVEKDGSGDFVTIQEAVDAAADGDTIAIGPGRFDGFWNPYSTMWHIARVEDKSLAFHGSGRDQTIIGPAELGGIDSYFVYCFFMLGDGIAMQFQDIRFENVQAAAVRLEGMGRLEVDDCDFVGCGEGIYGYIRDGGWIRNCQFEDVGWVLLRVAINLMAPSVGVEIAQCTFTNCFKAASANWAGSHGHVVRDCVMTGGRTAISLTQGASMEIRDCAMTGQSWYAVVFSAPTTVVLEGNHIDLTGTGGLPFCHYSGQGSYFMYENTFISDGTIMRLNFQGFAMDSRDNHFIRSGPDAWYVWPGQPNNYDQIRVIDFSNNWWGTDDPDEVAAWIFDVNDDPQQRFEIVYLPMNGTVATEARSWSAVKGLFEGSGGK